MQELKFQLPENHGFPETIFEDLTVTDAVNEIANNLTAIQEKQVYAKRLMTAEEIAEIRIEYGDIAEQEIPKLRAELAEATETYKEAKERLTSLISASDTQFKDLVWLAREGVKDFEVDKANTFRIPVSGKYLYYSWTGEKMQLVKIVNIPESEKFDIFNTGTNNKEAFERMGYEVPELAIENRINYRTITLPDNSIAEIWEENGKEHVIKRYQSADGQIKASSSTPETYDIGLNPYENGEASA